MPRKHTYLETHTLSAPVLTFSISAEDIALRSRADAAKAGRAATTLVKEGRLRVTLIAMRKGARMSPHQVEGVVSIQSIRGKVRIAAENEVADIGAGGLLVMQEEVTHTAEALSDCALLVTVAM